MPKKVIEESVYLTEKSNLLFEKLDFSDTFSTTNQDDNLEEISNLVFNNFPKWIMFLMNMRNGIAKYLGLKTNIPDDYNEDFRVGGYVKFFKIYDLSDDEIIMGADDSHLNFRAVINLTNVDSYNVKVTTLVKFNNKMGYYYMKVVKPFHRWVLMSMVGHAYKPS